MKTLFITSALVIGAIVSGCTSPKKTGSDNSSDFIKTSEANKKDLTIIDSAYIELRKSPTFDSPTTNSNTAGLSSKCDVKKGSLRENLERIAHQHNANLVWLSDGDLSVDLPAMIPATSYQDCVSRIIAAFQHEGATISATERDNAILIKER